MLHKRSFLLCSLIAAHILLLLFVSACGQRSEGQNNASEDNSSQSVSNLTHIAVRNSTYTTALAWKTGLVLITKGYAYSNGFTVDIGNIHYPIQIGNSSFQSTKSFILIPEGNEKLRLEAQKLQKDLGFDIKENTMFISLILSGPFDGPTNTIFVILGSDDSWELLNEFDENITNITALGAPQTTYAPQFTFSDDISVSQLEPCLTLR